MRFWRLSLVMVAACLTRPAPYESPPLPAPGPAKTAEPAASVSGPTPSASAAASAAAPQDQAAGPDGLPVSKSGVLSAAQANAILKLGEPPVVKLLSPGSDPKTALAFDLKPKSKQTTEMRMTIAMAVSQGGAQAAPSRLPEVSVLLDVTTGSRTQEGDIGVTGEVAKVLVLPKGDAEAAVAKEIAASLEPTKGLKVTYLVSPKGRARNLSVDTAKVPARAKQMVEQLKQSFEAMSVPLPVEPIGVGARWQVISRMQSGADVLQFNTYRLLSAQDGKLELENELVQFAAGPLFTPDGMNAPVTISEFASRGKGRTTVLLSKVAPEASEAGLRGHIRMVMPNGGGEAVVDTEVGVRFQLPVGSAPKGSKPAGASKPTESKPPGGSEPKASKPEPKASKPPAGSGQPGGAAKKP